MIQFAVGVGASGLKVKQKMIIERNVMENLLMNPERYLRLRCNFLLASDKLQIRKYLFFVFRRSRFSFYPNFRAFPQAVSIAIKNKRAPNKMHALVTRKTVIDPRAAATAGNELIM